MCRSMVDIQSATAEIRRGIKKEDRRKKLQGKNIMSASATQGGHKQVIFTVSLAELVGYLVDMFPLNLFRQRTVCDNWHALDYGRPV